MPNTQTVFAAIILLFATSCNTERNNAPQFIGKWDINDAAYIHIAKDLTFQFVAIEDGESTLVASGDLEIEENGALLTATVSELDKIQVNIPMLRLKPVDQDMLNATDLQWGGDSILCRHLE